MVAREQLLPHKRTNEKKKIQLRGMPEHVGRDILLSTARLSELQAALTQVLREDGGED